VRQFVSLNYDRPMLVADGVTVTFRDAGHILGSTAVLIEANGRRILYTGDVNFHNQSLMHGARLPEKTRVLTRSSRAARHGSSDGAA
jgi:metallo-beta-lactamase family protein